MEEYIEHKVKSKVEKFFRKFFKFLFIILAAIVFILLFGYAFMWLWNWLMPDIFGLPIIGYWQAIGLLVLAKLIFGGFEGKGSRKNGNKSKNRCRPRNKWASKNDFSKWKHYENFWTEEGEKAYKAYVARRMAENEDKANGH